MKKTQSSKPQSCIDADLVAKAESLKTGALRFEDKNIRFTSSSGEWDHFILFKNTQNEKLSFHIGANQPLYQTGDHEADGYPRKKMEITFFRGASNRENYLQIHSAGLDLNVWLNEETYDRLREVMWDSSFKIRISLKFLSGLERLKNETNKDGNFAIAELGDQYIEIKKNNEQPNDIDILKNDLSRIIKLLIFIAERASIIGCILIAFAFGIFGTLRHWF